MHAGGTSDFAVLWVTMKKGQGPLQRHREHSVSWRDILRWEGGRRSGMWRWAHGVRATLSEALSKTCASQGRAL